MKLQRSRLEYRACQSLPVRVLLLRHKLPVALLEHMTHRLSSPILQLNYSVVCIASLGAAAVTFLGKLLMRTAGGLHDSGSGSLGIIRVALHHL